MATAATSPRYLLHYPFDKNGAKLELKSGEELKAAVTAFMELLNEHLVQPTELFDNLQVLLAKSNPSRACDLDGLTKCFESMVFKFHKLLSSLLKKVRENPPNEQALESILSLCWLRSFGSQLPDGYLTESKKILHQMESMGLKPALGFTNVGITAANLLLSALAATKHVKAEPRTKHSMLGLDLSGSLGEAAETFGEVVVRTMKWFGLDCQPFMCHSVKGELDKKITGTLKRASFVFLDYSQTSSEAERQNMDETAGNLIKVGATLVSTVKYKDEDRLFSRVSFEKESGGLFQYIMRTESDVRCRLSSASSCILDRTGDDPGSPSVTRRHTEEGERKRTGSVSSPVPPPACKRGKKLAIVPRDQETLTLPPSSISLGNEFPEQFMADEDEEAEEARDQRETEEEEANTNGRLTEEETETTDQTGDEETQQHEDQPEEELGDDEEPSITDHEEYGSTNVCDLHSNCHVSVVTADNIRFTLCRVQLSHHSQTLRHQLEGGDSHIALKIPSRVFSAWLDLAVQCRGARQDAEPHVCPPDGESLVLLIEMALRLESNTMFARLSEWLAQSECDWQTKLQLVHLVADSPMESQPIMNALVDCLAKETHQHLNELVFICPPLSQMAHQRRTEMDEAQQTENTNMDVDDKLFALLCGKNEV